MRKPCKFTEADARRAIRAVKKEGVHASVDIMPDGRISIVPLAEPAATAITGATGPNEWDSEL